MRAAGIQYPNDRLGRLLDACWCSYDRLCNESFVVWPAIPILFFGDSHRYFSSELKVITVGLNPSKLEFPSEDPMSRFAAASAIAANPDQRCHDRHLSALDAYFRPTSKPYRPWFSSLEPMLNGLGASYYEGQAHAALHTDLCSPLATDPPWSKLQPDQRSLLQADGVEIWHSLVEVLSPDVILISIAKSYVDQIRFPVIAARELIWELDREFPYRVWQTRFTVGSKQSLMAYGRAAQTPFGTIGKEQKIEIGKAIRERFDALGR